MNNRIQEIMDLEHFKTLTPIQEQVLNRKNKNRDIIGVSSTGSGKSHTVAKIIQTAIDGKNEKWILQFKNETHNHPTEIEPFGGAATCIGGAIRDPLSGRTYVYQALRISGAANPNEKVEDTLSGKLPQKTITTKAAHGYSSYGNQIGLSTTFVNNKAFESSFFTSIYAI